MRKTTGAVLALFTASGVPAFAEPMKLSDNIALYCANADKLVDFAADALKASQTNKEPPQTEGCGVIPPGTTIEVSQKASKEGLIVGVASHAGKTVAFLTVETKGAAAKAAAAPVQTSSAGRTFKAVSPSDVRNTPSKWEGRDIEFGRVQVYWVDDNDVRFLTGTSVTLFGLGGIRGEPDTLKHMRENCETEREALSSKCSAKVRFSYAAHSEDKPNGFVARKVLMSKDIEVIRLGGKRR